MADFSQRREPLVYFIAEQDGEPEQELKSMLCKLFASGGTVQRAYLVLVQFGTEGLIRVATAVVAAPESRDALVRSVGAVFRSLFSVGQDLDILFPSEKQEAEILAVCRPFYQE